MPLGLLTALPFALMAVALMAGLGAKPASAGDFATLEPLGFSADGRVFAFEQHGILDGAGFPYSRITFVDLDRDAFVAPSPIEIVLEEDGATPGQARAEARRRAEPLFEAHDPASDPGYVAAMNPATEVSADRHRIAFRPRPFEPWPDSPIELRIDIVDPAPATPACEGIEVVGYRLTMVATEAGREARLLHEDAAVPDSRDCPLDYEFSAIVIGGLESGALRGVAIVSVKSNGFEGPNLRYLAEPFPID